jgi:2-polyprenyl-3-methyl-5-hydroxy-6-metoxy-1,4-benzoquinol methylase
MPDRRFFPNEIFRVVECKDCGLGFVNPRPTIQEIAKYYPAEYYRHPGTQSFDRYLVTRFTREARYLPSIPNGAGPKSLLDVGCANGDFPRFMAARGWQVEGVEVSQSSSLITDFPVYQQEFQSIPVDQPAYDAVTAWAVLEHAHDPMAYFHKASQVTRPGGLFVFAVTNFHSAASRHLFCEDIPRHLYFFTRDTVRQYAQKNGFTLEREDNGRAIYKMAPQNWLSYVVKAKLLGGEFSYQDIPMSSREFRLAHGLKPGLMASLRYLAYSPAATFDRMLWPLVESMQILSKNYGISVYVTRKR